MIGLPGSVKIYLATGSTDLRKGYNGLSGIVRDWGPDLYSGHLFVFFSRRGNTVKILTWDRGGFVVWHNSLFHRGAELLQPIYNRLFEITRHDPYVSADETGLGIQKKGDCVNGWVWVMLSINAIVYYFSKSRGGKIAAKLLGDTTGYLQIDGYSGYNIICDEENGGRVRVGCWSHARRLFFEALSELSENLEVLKWI